MDAERYFLDQALSKCTIYDLEDARQKYIAVWAVYQKTISEIQEGKEAESKYEEIIKKEKRDNGR